MKKVFEGISIWPQRMFGNSGYIPGAYCLISRHYPWSITWSWAVYWSKKPASMYWWLYAKSGCGFSYRKQDEVPYPKGGEF